LHLHAQRFCAPAAAHAALAAWATRWKYHRLASSPLTAHQRSGGQGRPTPRTPRKASAWHIQAQVHAEARERAKPATACSVLGTKSDASEVRETAVLVAYTGQAQVAGGVRFLQAPRFFVASLLVKKPPRIAGCLMVMPLALLVYAVAQRRLRKQ
jgi:hypothetical protein